MNRPKESCATFCFDSSVCFDSGNVFCFLIRVGSCNKDMEGNNLKRKAKNKQWYKNQKRRKFALCPDIRGFLLFCNHKERETIREGYNLLNEYADQSNDNIEDDTEEKSDQEDDIDAQLEAEKSALKTESTEKRFQVVESGVQNVLFVKTTLKDPVQLATRILEDIQKTGTQKTRHLIRLIPIQITCKAYDANVKTAVESLVKKFENNAKTVTYQVLFKSRCNTNLVKEDAIKIVQQVTSDQKQISFKADLKNPDVCFVFEVMKSNCCIGILPNYFGYKKYNLIEVASSNKKDETKPEDADETATKPEKPQLKDDQVNEIEANTKDCNDEK